MKMIQLNICRFFNFGENYFGEFWGVSGIFVCRCHSTSPFYVKELHRITLFKVKVILQMVGDFGEFWDFFVSLSPRWGFLKILEKK
jgi:hypothetical protein